MNKNKLVKKLKTMKVKVKDLKNQNSKKKDKVRNKSSSHRTPIKTNKSVKKVRLKYRIHNLVNPKERS